MRTEREEKEIVKRALALLHGGPKTERQDQQIGEPKPEAGTVETIAASILAENKQDEAALIVDAWQRYFGTWLPKEGVLKQLEGIRKWQSRWVNGNGNEG